MILRKLMLPLVVGISLLSCSVLKNKPIKKNDPDQSKIEKKDTTKKILPYNEVITAKAITNDGLLKIHRVDNKWYFEIADSLLQRDLLIVNRISKGSAEAMVSNHQQGFAGDHIGENVIRFDKGRNNKLFIRRISFLELNKDSSENGLYRSIANSNLQPIIAAFDIKTFSSDSSSLVIDVTDYINGDNDVFFFNPFLKTIMGLGGYQTDKSYVVKINSYPLNTEIKTVKTYAKNDRFVTYELNSSVVLLPSEPMKPRYNNPRVGYFLREYLDFTNEQRVKKEAMITRWRLEPKPDDIEKYKSGQLVEPQKPIVFYIDPTTPKKWVPYLMKGVNAWQKSFEKAGFKNAIYAREVSVNDTSWSLEDARHNVIVYKPSSMPNASGPHVHDPRSGEILESHINWYHNVLKLLHDWYFIQASPNDARARKMKFDDELMGSLISYVCAHEVGHTLGLQHNFIASSAIPVDSLRSKTYVAKNSHTPSIMDYARFNYVAQPEDGIAVNDLVPRIGAYDDWAIEWGYKWLPDFNSVEEEKAYLHQWVINKTQVDKRLIFSNFPIDIRGQAEDLGDDATKAGRYGIKNLNRIVSNLKEWTYAPIDGKDNQFDMYMQVINQYDRYLGHVFNTFRGLYIDKKDVDQVGASVSLPDRQKLKSCVSFFNDELFTTPELLNRKEFFSGMGYDAAAAVAYFQSYYVQMIISAETYFSLTKNKLYNPKDNSYDFDELLTDMEDVIFSELKAGTAVDFIRRRLQKEYIHKLINNVRQFKNVWYGRTDFTNITEAHFKELYAKMKTALSIVKDKTTKLHLEDLATRLKVAMDYQQKNFQEVYERVYPAPKDNSIELNDGFIYKFFSGNSKPDTSPIGKSCWSNQECNHVEGVFLK